jgi:hypothetical protein
MLHSLNQSALQQIEPFLPATALNSGTKGSITDSLQKNRGPGTGMGKWTVRLPFELLQPSVEEGKSDKLPEQCGAPCKSMRLRHRIIDCCQPYAGVPEFRFGQEEDVQPRLSNCTELGACTNLTLSGQRIEMASENVGRLDRIHITDNDDYHIFRPVPAVIEGTKQSTVRVLNHFLDTDGITLRRQSSGKRRLQLPFPDPCRGGITTPFFSQDNPAFPFNFFFEQQGPPGIIGQDPETIIEKTRLSGR